MPVGNPITDISSAGNYVPITRTLTINGVAFDLSANRTWTVGTGSVTSVGLIMPTGFAVSSSPITSSGDLTVAFASGYSLPTTASQTNWDSAYSNRITSLTTTGNSGVSTLISNTLNVPEYTLAGLGGMANVFTTLGDLVYGNAGGLPVRRSPNITATKMFLSQTGDGTTSAAPQWSTVTATDVGAVPTSRTITINGTAFDLSADRTYNVGTVTSVALSVPTGLSITGSPITGSGTLAIGLQSGYSIPTTSSQTNWDAAYNDKINSAAVTGTTTKTLTLNQQDGGTVTATWTDDNTDAVTSVFGRTGAVVAVGGDYNTSQVTEVTNLYYTDTRARLALSFAAGSGDYNNTTGVIIVGDKSIVVQQHNGRVHNF